MLPQVDYLTVHTPLTDETRNLIGMPQLDSCAAGVRLINCARGGIYDEAALVEGLKSGKIGGVALDVFASEPCTDSPLFGMPGVLCTPHLGASTEEAQTQVAVEGVGLLVDFLTTGAIRHAVNMTPLDRQDAGRPARLSRRRLSAGPAAGAVRNRPRSSAACCTIAAKWPARTPSCSPPALPPGCWHNALEEDINIVNAEVLLRERGIELVEQRRSDMGAFSSVIVGRGRNRVAQTHKRGRHAVRQQHAAAGAARRLPAGSLSRRRAAGLHASATCRASSASVGTIFGKHKVNIAQMAVGRDDQGRRGHRRAESRPGPAAGRAGRSAIASGHQKRDRHQAAAGRRTPRLAGRLERGRP